MKVIGVNDILLEVLGKQSDHTIRFVVAISYAGHSVAVSVIPLNIHILLIIKQISTIDYSSNFLLINTDIPQNHAT